MARGDIEAFERVAERLRESEERFRGTFEQAAVGIAHVAPDGRWLRVNRRLCDIVGYTERELRARTFQDITHPDDLDKDLGYVRDMLDGKIQTYAMEKRYFRKDGSVVWIELTVSLVRELSGRPKYFISVVQDIDARKRMESALRESEERFRLITETIDEVFWMADAAIQRSFYVSPAYERVWGRTRESLHRAPRSFLDAIHPQDRGRTIAHLEQRGGQPFDIEYRIVRPDGCIRWISDRGFPVRNDSGPVTLYVGVAQDITERRRAEEIKRLHERATTMVNDILRAINVHLDLKAAFPEVCAGLRELAGCAAVSLNLFDERREWVTFAAADAPWALGVGGDVRISAAEFPGVSDVLARRPHVVGDLAAELQFPVVRVVYALGFRSIVSLPLCAGSEVVGFLNLFWREVEGCHAGEMGLLTQVTNAVALAVEKSRLFEQVRVGHERLVALSRRLIEVQESERRNLAHELHDEMGQTVTAVRFLLDTVGQPSSPAARARLEQVQQLVTDLLMQIRNLSLKLRPSMLDDLGLLPALVWLFERYTVQTGVHVSFNQRGLDRRFDPEIETVGYRVVQEALTNVARHARVDHVDVRGWVDNSNLVLEVVDDGAGFNPDAAEATMASMGLAGMRERVLRLAGRLSVQSRLGAGTRVLVEMPLSTGE